MCSPATTSSARSSHGAPAAVARRTVLAMLAEEKVVAMLAEEKVVVKAAPERTAVVGTAAWARRRGQ